MHEQETFMTPTTLVLLQLLNKFFVLVTEPRMSATDTAMDTGEKVYGGCEGPDAM